MASARKEILLLRSQAFVLAGIREVALKMEHDEQRYGGRTAAWTSFSVQLRTVAEGRREKRDSHADPHFCPLSVDWLRLAESHRATQAANIGQGSQVRTIYESYKSSCWGE